MHSSSENHTTHAVSARACHRLHRPHTGQSLWQGIARGLKLALGPPRGSQSVFEKTEEQAREPFTSYYCREKQGYEEARTSSG